jgi:acetolactate synthase regulatory subunit
MSYELMVDLDHEEGSLCRLLGLIERRGFQIERMELFQMGRGRRADLQVKPLDESRDIGVLQRQVERLLISIDGELAPMKCVRPSDSDHPLVG